MATDLPYGGKVSLDELLQCRTLPRDVGRRLQESAGSEGQVTVDAVVGLLVDERRAADDRKLTRSIIIQLLVALVVLLAAFAGSIYMVVKLDRVVGNDNGIMVSRSTGQPLAVGSVSKISNAANLYEINNLDDLSEVKSVHVQLQGAEDALVETVFQVASAIVTPGQSALLTTTTGDQFESDSEGFRWVNSTSADAGGSRRKLMQESGMVSALTSSLSSIVITPDNPAKISCPSGVVVPDSCSTDKDCECGGTLTKCQNSKCQDVCLNQDDACSSDEQCSCWGEIFAFCDFDKGSVCRPSMFLGLL